MPDYPRSAHIDDTDPRFIFRGNWTAKQTTDPWGISGSPFNSTLHESSSGGVVIFRFKNAAYFSIYGHIDTINNRPKPSWTCSLDQSIGTRTEAPDSRRMSHFPFCKSTVGDSGEHQLTMNITVPLGGIIEIDAIEVAPHEGVTITEGEILQVQDTDPAVIYAPKDAWNVTSEAGTHSTDTNGASVQFNFTGTSVQFISVNLGNHPATPGEYRIDGEQTTEFVIPTTDANTFNNILFSKDGLSNGNHSMNVTFLGEKGDAPLQLGSFFVTLPPGESPLVSSAPIIELHNDEPPVKKSSKAGGVVGGVVGFLLLVIASFFIWRHYRRRRRGEERSATASVTPFVENKPPEPTTPPGPVSIIHPPASLVSQGESVDGKPGLGPIILSYEPTRLEILHEDSGYRASPSGGGGVSVQEIPPVYSPA